MSTMNIAIAGGVVLLILVLLKLRRANAADSPAPSRGRTRGERRRRRGKDAPPAPSEPMPLAAAAGQTAATAEADHFAPPAAEWPPADEPAPEAWPPADEAGPVEWPDTAPTAAPAEAPAEAPVAARAEEPAPAPAEPQGWAEDEIVTEPGWPMPGEVDVAWTPPSAHEPIPTAPPVAAGPAPSWEDEAAATAAPERFEWLSADPEDEAPAWTPPGPPAEEAFAWAPPEDAAPAWEAPAEEPEASGWDAAPESFEDAQPTGPIPAISFDEPAEAVAEEPEAFVAPGAGGVRRPRARVVRARGLRARDLRARDLRAGVVRARVLRARGLRAGVVRARDLRARGLRAGAVRAAPETTFEVPAYAPGPVAAEPVAVAEPVSAEPVTAWWDEEPVAAEPAPRESAADDPARAGRFALGGFAMQPGQQALGGVSFRAELPGAPESWAVADGADAESAGTLVLYLDGTINCAAGDLEVVMEPGFAPTTQGFTVRVAALAAGPFAASGTFRVK